MWEKMSLPFGSVECARRDPALTAQGVVSLRSEARRADRLDSQQLTECRVAEELIKVIRLLIIICPTPHVKLP
jgi:hypothetical protein